MKTLTIHPEWAWAIMAGHKRVENRTWSTRYRGLLAIHAGRSGESEAEARRTLAEIGVEVPEIVVKGAILGTVELVDVVRYGLPPIALPGMFYDYRLRKDPLAVGPFCWILANPRLLPEPIPCLGQQGLWESD